MKAVGEVAKLLNHLTVFFSKEKYQDRLEDSLIDSADEIVLILSKRKKLTKKLDHYVRQYEANRRKLK